AGRSHSSIFVVAVTFSGLRDDEPPRRSAQAELPGAGRPGPPPLRIEYPFGDLDLLRPAGLVRHTTAAVGLPGRLRELQAAVVAVAGRGVPPATALALRDAVPVTLRSR